MNRSDITLLITDASELATSQDSHITGLAWDMCRGIIVVVNKWDLISDTDRYAKRRAVRKVRECLHFMPYAPISFISAKTGYGIKNLKINLKKMLSESKLDYSKSKIIIN